jgi:uncharacterized protein YcbK (DUF882 family)
VTSHTPESESTDRTHQSLGQLRLEHLKPLDLIAPDFRAYELTRSDLAERLGIDNRFPGVGEMQAAVYLARKVLQPIRDKFGPITPKSLFRSQALDRVLKRKPSTWISASQHTLGSAADIEVIGVPTITVARWAADNLPQFDQIICECYDSHNGPNSGWVHISLKRPRQGKNRRQLLTYIRDPEIGCMRFVEGLHDQHS